MKPHKISTHSADSDSCYFHFSIRRLIELKKILKDSVFYLKTKSFIQNKKASFTDPIFSKGFDHSLLKKDWRPKSTFLDSRGHFHQH